MQLRPRKLAWCLAAVWFLGGIALGAAQAPKAPPAPHRWLNPPPRSLPAGVTHHRFQSASMGGKEVGYCVYLPPGYDADRSTRYPVLYWLHGGNGNELTGVSVVAPVADQAIRSGEVSPLIVVFVNGGPAWHYDVPESRQMGETAFFAELIPQIDRTFRTIADRRGRAIEGMSMGGRGTTRAIFKHPELFCSAAALAAGIGNEQKAVDAGQHRENNVFFLARQYAGNPQPPVRFLVVVGTKDVNYASNLEYMSLLRSLKIPFDQIVLEGVTHSNREYYERMHAATLKWHAESFRLAQSRPEAGRR